MELKKVLVLFGVLGIFASGFGAESYNRMQPAPSPPSTKFLAKGADETGAVEEPRATFAKSGKNGPENVILLVVDELNRNDLPAYLENRNEFPVHGQLKVCPVITNHSTLNTCDCDEQLASSIASLISWAQRANISISRLYEISTSFSDPRARLIYQHQVAPWLLEIERSSDKEKTKIESKLKDTFLSSLVNRLSTAQLRESEPSIVHLSDVAELTSTILRGNENGHLMVLHTKTNEISNVLEFLKRYVSPQNTLTVIMNSCPQDRSNLIPFFAGGIGSEQLSRIESSSLQDLPSVIRDILHVHKETDVEPAMVSMPEDFIPKGRNVRRVFNYQKKIKRSDGAGDGDAGDAQAGTDSPDAGGQDAIAPSSMMMVTLVTTVVTYILKF